MKTEEKLFSRRWFSSILSYLVLIWSLVCLLAVPFIILQYEIFKGGLIAMIVTLFFAAVIWAVPFSALVILQLYLNPAENGVPRVMFRDLIRKGMREMKEA